MLMCPCAHVPMLMLMKQTLEWEVIEAMHRTSAVMDGGGMGALEGGREGGREAALWVMRLMAGQETGLRNALVTHE